MKEKVRNFGVEWMSDHEILELLLTYSIPRKDTNIIAHRLLEAFGSIDRCIDADQYDLLKIEGVGKETAVFFKILSSVYETYKFKKSKKQENVLTTDSAVQYFRDNFPIKEHEEFYVLCVSSSGKVVNRFRFEGDEVQILIDTKMFADRVNTAGARYVILIHTHPHGEAKPSAEDVETTNYLFNLCSIMKVQLVDHIIITENDHFSFKSSDQFRKLQKVYTQAFPDSIETGSPYVRRK